MSDGSGRTIEIDLDAARLAVLAVIALAALAAAFWLGRVTGPAGPRPPAAARDAGEGAGPGAGAGAVEDVGAGATLFDREGGGVERTPGRQTTAEQVLAGGWLLDCGRSASRTAAERVRAALARAGVPASVLRAPDGAFRTVGGPFASREDAARAARRAEEVLGRRPEVVEESGTAPR